MKAEAIYVVISPKGYVSEPSISLSRNDSKYAYMRQWLPQEVGTTAFELEPLWACFARAGYTVKEIKLPKELDGREVCRT